MPIEYLQPDGMHHNPAFTQAIVVSGPVKTVYIGQQNAVNANGEIVGTGDLAAQTKQAYDNIDRCLAAAGATKDQIVSLTITINAGESLQDGFSAAMAWWGNRPNPPTNSVMFVAAHAHPDFLVGIEAIAVVPLAEA